jgi:hypothetical protein
VRSHTHQADRRSNSWESCASADTSRTEACEPRHTSKGGCLYRRPTCGVKSKNEPEFPLSVPEHLLLKKSIWVFGGEGDRRHHESLSGPVRNPQPRAWSCWQPISQRRPPQHPYRPCWPQRSRAATARAPRSISSRRTIAPNSRRVGCLSHSKPYLRALRSRWRLREGPRRGVRRRFEFFGSGSTISKPWHVRVTLAIFDSPQVPGYAPGGQGGVPFSRAASSGSSRA